MSAKTGMRYDKGILEILVTATRILVITTLMGTIRGVPILRKSEMVENGNIAYISRISDTKIVMETEI